MSAYLDTSAAAKLLIDEPESTALARHLDDLPAELAPVSSVLLETELRRFAVRVAVPQAAVTDVLARVALVEPDRALFHEAGLLPGHALRSLDALHLATAIRVGAVDLISYDMRLLGAARDLGLSTSTPRA